MNHTEGEGNCKYCGVEAIFWPPPRLMHVGPMNPKTGEQPLYRYCQITVAEIEQ